jgi:hypothetical protein
MVEVVQPLHRHDGLERPNTCAVFPAPQLSADSSSRRLGDELMNKVFGHEAGEVGEGYGRDLSPDEAHAVADAVKAPIALEHLWIGRRKA